MKNVIRCLVFLLIPMAAHAAPYWSPSLTNWQVFLDNGVVYISATNMPSHCAFSRAQIDTSSAILSATYQRDIYAYVMAAYAAEKPLSIVLDNAESTCKVYGANDRP